MNCRTRCSELAARREANCWAWNRHGRATARRRALRAEAARLKLQMERLRRTRRAAEWQEAERLHSARCGARRAPPRPSHANEGALAEAKRTLAELETDGLIHHRASGELAERRRECESADERCSQSTGIWQHYRPTRPNALSESVDRIAALGDRRFRARERHTSRTKAAARDNSCTGAIHQPGRRGGAGPPTGTRRRPRRHFAWTRFERLKTAVDEAKAKALAGIAEPVEARATVLLERISGRPLARVQLGEGMALRFRPAGGMQLATPRWSRCRPASRNRSTSPPASRWPRFWRRKSGRCWSSTTHW